MREGTMQTKAELGYALYHYLRFLVSAHDRHVAMQHIDDHLLYSIRFPPPGWTGSQVKEMARHALRIIMHELPAQYGPVKDGLAELRKTNGA